MNETLPCLLKLEWTFGPDGEGYHGSNNRMVSSTKEDHEPAPHLSDQERLWYTWMCYTFHGGHLEAIVRALLLQSDDDPGLLPKVYRHFQTQHPKAPELDKIVRSVEDEIPPEGWKPDGLSQEEIPITDEPLTFGELLKLRRRVKGSREN